MSALERLPESPGIPLALPLETPNPPVCRARPEIPEIPRRVPVMEKIPYVIAPFR